MRLSGYQALAFDFDGVLADTIGAHTQARADALTRMTELTGDRRFGEIPTELQAEAHRHGSVPEAIIGWLLTESALAESLDDPIIAEVVAAKHQIYWERAQRGLDDMHGALAFVRRAAAHYAGNMAIVTTASKTREVNPFLLKHGLENQFDVVVGKEDVISTKPSPLPYRHMLARMDMSRRPNSILAMEDSPYGIESARRAGVPVVGIATTHSVEDLSSLNGLQEPDYIVNDFRELTDALGL